MKLQLNLLGQPKWYNLDAVDRLPIVVNFDTIYRIRRGGAIFYAGLNGRWIKLSDDIKVVDFISKLGIEHQFYAILNRNIIFQFLDDKFIPVQVDKASVTVTQLPPAGDVLCGVFYTLMPHGIEYVTYTNRQWEIANDALSAEVLSLPNIADAQVGVVYMIKDSPNQYITYDGNKWIQLTGEEIEPVQVVDTLPDAADALPATIYLEKDTRKEFITYDNVNWTQLSGEELEPQVVDSLPNVSGAIRNMIYILRDTRMEFITYDNLSWTQLNPDLMVVDALPPVRDARRNTLYLEVLTSIEYITYTNASWVKISSDLMVVDALPPVAGALRNTLYIDRTTNIEYITYDNTNWINITKPDAPVDGLIYARRNQEWVQIGDVQVWLPAVNTYEQLTAITPPYPDTVNYLCSVIGNVPSGRPNLLRRIFNKINRKVPNDGGAGVYQWIAGGTEWTFFCNNSDFVTHTELTAGLATKQNSLNRTVQTDLGNQAWATDTGGSIMPGVIGTLSVVNGGTGASDAATARLYLGAQRVLDRTVQTNLGSTAAATDTGDDITPGVTGTLPVAAGGTGATDAAGARVSLGAQETLVSGTNIKTVAGNVLLGNGNVAIAKADVGLGNADNTSDANKPVSTATQTALNAKQNSLNRTVQTNLGSTAAATDTGDDITPGVTGMLAVSNGGTAAGSWAQAKANLRVSTQAFGVDNSTRMLTAQTAFSQWGRLWGEIYYGNGQHGWFSLRRYSNSQPFTTMSGQWHGANPPVIVMSAAGIVQVQLAGSMGDGHNVTLHWAENNATGSSYNYNWTLGATAITDIVATYTIPVISNNNTVSFNQSTLLDLTGISGTPATMVISYDKIISLMGAYSGRIYVYDPNGIQYTLRMWESMIQADILTDGYSAIVRNLLCLREGYYYCTDIADTLDHSGLLLYFSGIGSIFGTERLCIAGIGGLLK
jgi:hypothetical protein